MKDAVSDLADRLAMLYTRSQVVFGSWAFGATPTDRLLIEHAANFYREAAAYLRKGLTEGHPDAIGKVRAVIDPADMDRSEFWATPLGRLMFAAGAWWQGETCTQAVAAAVLGCSRQWISAMVAEGKLDRAHEGGVPVDQVREVLKRRAARLLDKDVK
jgi:hypothetical protein